MRNLGRNLESLTDDEIEFIVQCIQSFCGSPNYKEERYDEIVDSIIDKL